MSVDLTKGDIFKSNETRIEYIGDKPITCEISKYSDVAVDRLTIRPEKVIKEFDYFDDLEPPKFRKELSINDRVMHFNKEFLKTILATKLDYNYVDILHSKSRNCLVINFYEKKSSDKRYLTISRGGCYTGSKYYRVWCKKIIESLNIFKGRYEVFTIKEGSYYIKLDGVLEK